MSAENCKSHQSDSLVSRLGLSPDSSEPGSTPHTPECTSIGCDFGSAKHAHAPSAGMTPTPPPSVEGPPTRFRPEAYRITGANPLSIGPLSLGLENHPWTGGDIWSSRSIPRVIGLGHSGDLSHIWANRQVTPPEVVHQTAGHHISFQYHGYPGVSSHDQSLTIDADRIGPNTSLAGQGSFAHNAFDDAQLPHVGSALVPHENLHRATVSHQQSPRHRQHVQPLEDVRNLWGARVVQDLGVDVLRISSPAAKHYSLEQRMPGFDSGYLPRQSILAEDPIRQPAPPPPAVFSGPHGSNTSTATTGFTPMHAVHEQTRAAFHPTGAWAPRQVSARFSTRYHGMHTEANASAEHLAPDQNCALWLTNLPPDVTPRQLLGAIRRVGRIWCSFINYPDYQSHHTAAAKIVFFSPQATQQFLGDSWTKGLYIGTSRVRVSHNRIKSESKEAELATPKSRVLIITGRAEFVNEAYLTKYFKDRFIFQNDEVTELISAGGRAVLEWRFGSYRCQSQMGKMSLEKDRPYWLEKVEFGEDPCEVGDTLSSYGVAAERIQGRGL